ncbi:hypothetical protein [Fodinicola acaciae]|uniref:hypothetical protein n=1 Tax=Fodinicola acaciae TaxID=2681555 RepID=UPI0013D42516|nr:hypothetical protein [Fodinicola acaciae]
MSIAKLSDAVVRWLVPQTTAAACIAPEPCDACANPTMACLNGYYTPVKYTLKVNNCNGQCTIYKKQICWRGDWAGVC